MLSKRFNNPIQCRTFFTGAAAQWQCRRILCSYGAFIGHAKDYAGLASAIGQAAGANVLVVDYRLTPEPPYTAAVDDVLAAYWG
ncbi:MAG: alpha/beta hydrolase [Burkholderiaceae bacterium]|jgi:hypothetical protein|nr:alpha/beta hydrolase [Burkholderiaceae bacterium]